MGDGRFRLLERLMDRVVEALELGALGWGSGRLGDWVRWPLL